MIEALKMQAFLAEQPDHVHDQIYSLSLKAGSAAKLKWMRWFGQSSVQADNEVARSDDEVCCHLASPPLERTNFLPVTGARPFAAPGHIPLVCGDHLTRAGRLVKVALLSMRR
jgi:hypothetical protein